MFKRYKLAETSKTLDKMKDLGFKYSTISGITVSAYDINVVGGKPERLAEAEKKVERFERAYKYGLLTEDERRRNVIDLWNKTKSSL